MRPQQKKKTMDLTQGPVLKQLILFALPLFLTLLLQQLYNTADRMVVGQFAGDLSLAAVGSVGYPLNLLLALLTGLATGANVVIANFRGAGNAQDTRRANHAAMMVAVIGGFALMAIGIPFSEVILNWMRTPKETLELSALYMRILFCGVPFSMIYNFGASILRAYGDSTRSLTILGISGIANVVLNLIFVICFGMGVAGVALATIISQAISAVWILRILCDPNGEFRMRIKELKLHKGITGSILRTGFPCSISSILFNISGVFVQSSINSFGPTVMAGSAASDSITNLSATVISALFNACISFAGQNYGARKYKRLDRLFISALVLGLSVGSVMALLCTLFPRALLSMFTSEADAITAGVPKLLCVSWGYLLQSTAYAAMGICRGMKKSTMPTVISAICLCVVRILWVSLVFPLSATTTVLYLCFPISFLCNAAGHTVYYLICRKKIYQRSIEP